MNTTRGFYKFLIFAIFIFIFLVFLPQEAYAVCSKKSEYSIGSPPCDPDCSSGECSGDTQTWWKLEDTCVVRFYICDCWSDPCGGGCFVEGTEVATKLPSDQAIENLEPGDIVSSFNPETGEISESQVAEVHKVTREGYYELETESGKKVKVTGEHPFLAVKSEENLISKLKNALSNTLTFRLITGLRTKLIGVLD